MVRPPFRSVKGRKDTRPMAALLEKVRDFQKHPVLSKERQAALYGISTPITRRASLLATRGNGATKAAPSIDAQSSQHDDAQVPLHTTDDLLRQGASRMAGFPWHLLFGGLGALVALYTVLFVIAFACIWIGNLFQYGPTHTAYTQAVINDQAYTVQTSNINGTILVTLINNKDGTAKVYSGPSLDPHAWNDDMSGIVVTAEVGKDQPTPTITIHVIGSITYLHLFFVRPQMTFLLVPDKQAGYSVAPSS